MAISIQSPTPSHEDLDALTLIEREGLPLTAAAKLIPSRKPGKRVDVNTLWRWCQKGMASGVRLRSVLIGNVRYTTKTWLREFIQARSATRDSAGTEPPRSPSARQSASERAAEELQKNAALIHGQVRFTVAAEQRGRGHKRLQGFHPRRG